MPTIAKYFESLTRSPIDTSSLSKWAPDVFALAAGLLQMSGAYTFVLTSWPPEKPNFAGDRRRWYRDLRDQAEAWRKAMDSGAELPAVRDALAQLLVGSVDLQGLAVDQRLAHVALELLALADEACVGLGIAVPERPFERRAAELLQDASRSGSSLCSEAIDHELMRVLPKQHTPTSGMTLRSLSHHLALHTGSEVVPHWRGMPTELPRGPFNVLLAPWPLAIHRTQFRPKAGTLDDMPRRFGFMTVAEPEDAPSSAEWALELVKAARSEVGEVQAVVFPECALSPADFDAVSSVAEEQGVSLLIGGVLERREPYSSNRVVIRSAAMKVEQAKHHRWKVDRSQIEQYGLSSRLSPNVDWWEDTEVRGREVNFVALSDELTMCCLVCEDLARQDPVASLVRSVGPSLVVALLMDAPQLAKRWPARYATVLSEDPGSSVLTLTSWGMASMATPPSGHNASRAVALWKDAHTGVREIELPQGHDGVVISLFNESRTEFSADGRSDGGVTSYPRLGGVFPVRSVAGRDGRQ